jgi:hypothetical protein
VTKQPWNHRAVAIAIDGNVVVVAIIVIVTVVLLPHTSYGYIIDTNNKYGNVPEQRGRVGGWWTRGK